MNRTQEVSRRLAGLSVTITGRLASMSRADAVRAIEAAGGRYSERPGPDTSLLVLGAGGPPLGPDGHPTKSLAQAQELRAAGAPIEIVSEEAWLARMELDREREELDRLYTTAQIARITGVPAATIRAWVRHRLLVPAKSLRRLDFFDFRQVAHARELADLVRSGVAPARIRRSLVQIGSWCDTRAPLAQLEVLEAGREVLVRLDDGRLAEPSGQLRLEFDADPAVAAVRALGDQRDAADPDPEGWFDRGVHAEEQGRLDAAAWAYARALAAGASAEVHFNLGNVLFLLHRVREAAEQFQAAAELEPDYVEAWNNLANVQSELGRPADAVRSYQRALSVAPDYADAHYNCAETMYALGDVGGAERHWRAYLELDPQSDWAREVRAKLERIEAES